MITEAQRDALARTRRARTRPIGSRRLTKRAKGTDYWEIKVEGQKRWVLEHRHVMAGIVGRPLRRDEHVHHKDGDGLNNDPENLELMSARDHCRLTSKQYGFGTWDRAQPHRCPCCGLLHAPAPVGQGN